MLLPAKEVMSFKRMMLERLPKRRRKKLEKVEEFFSHFKNMRFIKILR